jgi:hypothetical protein
MMSEANEKPAVFLGTYFDRDGVLRLARWADVMAWIILTIYVLWWLPSFLMFLGQFLNGMFGDKGSTFLNFVSTVAGQLQLLLPGVFYFFGLQGISKGLLMFMDMEDNTRRAARR